MHRILRTSSTLHDYKAQFAQALQGKGWGIAFKIIAGEVWLFLLSIPAYMFVKQDAIVATFAEHPDDVVRYQARSGILSRSLKDRAMKRK